jgi:hypothetical protein
MQDETPVNPDTPPVDDYRVWYCPLGGGGPLGCGQPFPVNGDDGAALAAIDAHLKDAHRLKKAARTRALSDF